MEVVSAQIGQLQSSRFIRDGDRVMPVLRGDPPPDALVWAELVPEHKHRIIEGLVNWEGFDREQQLDVIQAVLEGKDEFHRMDGIRGDRSYEDALRDAAEMAEHRPANDNARDR